MGLEYFWLPKEINRDNYYFQNFKTKEYITIGPSVDTNVFARNIVLKKDVSPEAAFLVKV